MMRRMQQKDIQQKKQSDKAAVKAAADSEFREDEVDPAELERIRKRQEGTQVTAESFAKWKIAFDEEMALKELEALRAGAGASAGAMANVNALSPLTAIIIGSGNAGSMEESGEKAVASAGVAVVAGGGTSARALLESALAADGRPTGKQFFLLNMGTTSGGKGGAEDPDAEPDESAEGIDGDELLGGVGGEEDDDDEDDDSDYVEEGGDNDDDDDGEDDDDEAYEDS